MADVISLIPQPHQLVWYLKRLNSGKEIRVSALVLSLHPSTVRGYHVGICPLETRKPVVVPLHKHRPILHWQEITGGLKGLSCTHPTLGKCIVDDEIYRFGILHVLLKNGQGKSSLPTPINMLEFSYDD